MADKIYCVSLLCVDKMTEEEPNCPICYERYRRGILPRDGKCNSDLSTSCKHYICVQCCHKMYVMSCRAIIPGVPIPQKCPICREDWTKWLHSNYPRYGHTDSEESSDSDNDSDSDSSDSDSNDE